MNLAQHSRGTRAGFRVRSQTFRAGSRAVSFLTLVFIAAFQLVAAGPALGFSYTGSLASDDDEREFFFTLSQPGAVTLRTYSYAGGTNSAGAVIPAGGFDPTISVFDSGGNLVAYNPDGGCANVAADPATTGCWDSFVAVTLPAGNYRAVLTQSENLPNGPTLADSFVYNRTLCTPGTPCSTDAQGNFTAAPGNGSPGFWDFYSNKRTAAYALDITGVSGSQVTTITSSNSLPSGIVGSSYQFLFAAQSGPGSSLAWSVPTGSSLPPGLILNSSTGALSGTAQSAGAFSFTVQTTDGVQNIAQTVTLAIYSPLIITTSGLPAGRAGQSYGPVSAAASGGSGGYVWSASGLQQDLAINQSGQITGTPSTGGSFNVLLSVSDAAASLSTSAAIPLLIAFAPLQITSSGNLGGYVPNASVSRTPTAAGGKTPYTWSSSGLPGGFNLDASSGAFSGAAPSAGTYSFTVNISDSQIPPATSALTVSFSVLGIVTSSVPPGSTTAPYSASFSAIGGTPPYTFSGLGIPTGLSLSASGGLGGSPQSVGTFGFTVQVADSAGLSTSSSFSLVVTGPSSPLKAPDGVLTKGSVSNTYSASLSASGGKPGYTWSLVGGTVPDGLSLDTDGTITGTAKSPGDFTFTAQATDSANATASGTFTITIDPAPLTLTSIASFPAGIVGSEYPVQILEGSGGTAPYTFEITSGALPDGLSFSSPQISDTPTKAGTFNFAVTLTDAKGKTAAAATSIKINPSHADLVISQSTVSFAMTVGSNGLPAPASVPVRSSVVEQLLNFSLDATASVPWLDFSGAGTTPGTVSLAVNSSAFSLAAAVEPYQATINVTCIAPSPCEGNIQTISVSLTVTAPPPQLSITSSLVSFSAVTSNPVASSQTLGIQNTGGGTLTINSVTTSDPWIAVSGVPAKLTAGSASSITVTADPSSLAANYYLGSISVSSSAGSASVPVSLRLTQTLTMSLSPSGSQFSAPSGSPLGSTSGSFNVGVSGGASASWVASVSPGADWLSVTTSGGVATPAASSSVTYSIDPVLAAGLAESTYYGTIQVSSGDVVNSPLAFVVVLNITSAATPVKPEPGQAGSVFISGLGSGSTPAQGIQSLAHSTAADELTSQTIPIYASSAAPIAYQASAITTDGAGWLSVSPATGFASATAPGQSVVAVNNAGLAPGVYRGGVSYAFSSDAVRTVNITLLVVASGGTSAPSAGDTISRNGSFSPAAVCAPTKLVPTQTGLVNNFAQPAGWPTPLAINVINDCGGTVAGGQVVATFSNGDPPLALISGDAGTGNFSGTWTPRSVSSQVTITARATAPNFPAAPAVITGAVRANKVPILSAHGTLHAFFPQVGGSLSPGSIIQIYGSDLSGGVSPSTTVPLTTALGQTSVLIGGIQAPLYYVSPGQVNAQLPFELAANNTYQILINANGALSTPDSIQLTPVSTGIAAFSTGLIIAQHPDFTLVTEDAPAKPGEFLVFYLAGLGITDTPVTSGTGSPSTTLARPVVVPVLTLNGNPLPVLFAGLTPTAVGLYQINFQVPADAPDGDLKLVVSQSGSPGNPTILPVKR